MGPLHPRRSALARPRLRAPLLARLLAPLLALASCGDGEAPQEPLRIAVLMPVEADQGVAHPQLKAADGALPSFHTEY